MKRGAIAIDKLIGFILVLLVVILVFVFFTGKAAAIKDLIIELIDSFINFFD